jgi:hypothetical protein
MIFKRPRLASPIEPSRRTFWKKLGIGGLTSVMLGSALMQRASADPGTGSSVTDDFTNYSQYGFLITPWTDCINPDPPVSVSNGRAYGSNNNPYKWQYAGIWNQSWHNDQYAQVTLGVGGYDANSGVSVFVRANSIDGGTTWPRLLLAVWNGGLYIQRYDGTGNAAATYAYTSYSPAAGDVVRLQAYGGMARALVNGSPAISETIMEVVPFGWMIGFGVYSNGARSVITNFQGGNIS